MRFLLSVAVALVVAWPGGARADRVDRLIQILRTDSSYKVRLQVVIALGKVKNDKRAVSALVTALSDGNYTVRGVAAATLGQLGDKRAAAPLKRATKDKHPFVRSQAEKALRNLGGGAGPPRGARFFVTVGKISNKAGRGGKELSQAFKDALLKEFSSVSRVATPWASEKPSATELRKHRLKGFVLDGSILSLTRKRSGSGMELSCSIKVSLATYPGNSMKAFYTGGASMEVDANSFRPAYEDSLFKEIVEGAAQGARQHIVSSYLNNQ